MTHAYDRERTGDPPRAIAGARFRTRAVHAGLETGDAAWALSDPISLAAVYACRDPAVADARRAADPPQPNYGRDGTPNVRALERAL
ncbi:MAG TPA: hypothetical protein VFQ80_04915, partial [Thermomicrobiales bacterium]|nr:hypothetical protein [Thermomicrobiales bacterium]